MLQAMRSAAKYIWWLIVIAFLIGFVFLGQSGLGSERRLTRGTAVATVNGHDITYDTWLRVSEGRLRQEREQSPRPLTLDEEQRIQDQAFNELVTSILLEDEYAHRGITVSDEEIQRAALSQPNPQLMQNPEFQTEGRFDIDKYRRFLSSPIAKQQGILASLEQYYRTEIPRQKLFEQVATSVFVSDGQLWRVWQDQHDSSQVSFVSFPATSLPDSAVTVTDAEIKQYYDAHQKQLGERMGRAVVTIASVPRTITAADTAAARAKAVALRESIVQGAKFEDVAKRESADSGSGAQGGSLGTVGKGQFVKPFEDAAFSLKPGEISQPVLSPFGFHIIRVSAHKGDSVTVSHILVKIQQSDSSAAVSDRRADSLSHGAGSDHPTAFDSVVTRMHLSPVHSAVVEGEPLQINGTYVPSVSAWAFGGAKPGETSELLDADDAYYLARLDSLEPGGKPELATVKDDIRREIAREKKLDLLVPKAQKVSAAVAGGKTLEQAAADAGMTVTKTQPFARVTNVPGLGQTNEAIGAAFGLAAGVVSAPIKTRSAVVVLRVDRRIPADRDAWAKQKDAQREQVLSRMRQQRVQEFLAGLRDNATVIDRRREIAQQNRQSSS